MSLNIKNFKNIIFDFGGVIININYSFTHKAFVDLGINDFDLVFSQASQNNLFDDYEKGNISSKEFRNELKKYSNIKLTNSQINNAWNAMLLDLPKERLVLLNKLKSSHTTFLLSNTNEIHINTINKYLKESFKINNLNSYFKKVYFSFEIGMRKPDEEIFHLVLKENKLKLSETLFIDDSVQHIKAAEKLGIQTYLLDVNKESILNILK